MRKYHGKDLSTNDFTDGYKKKIDSMQTLYRFKGTVDTVNDLSSIEDRNIGDTYKCKANSNTYIWNGTEWINAGQDVDYSEILEQIDTYQEEVNTQLTNIEQEGIIVSPTEPVTNRRKVWMQKGKNLFDESNYNYINANLDVNGLIIAGAVNYKLIYVEVESNTKYKISCDVEKSLVMNTTNETPQVGMQGTARIVVTAKEYYITTNSNAKYLCLRADTNNAAQNYLNINLKIQKEEKIYILNDNNVYEEFMKKEKNEALVNLTIPTTGGYDSSANYPEGFNSTNCYVVGVMMYRKHPTNTAITTWHSLSGNYYVRLENNRVVLNVGVDFSEQYLGNPAKIILRKFNT